MQYILLGLIDQNWFVKTIHLCCNSCPRQVATWISWPRFVWVMKWLWTAWPLHCSVAMPLPLLLCGGCWQEDLSPEFTPQWVFSVPPEHLYPPLEVLWWCHHLLSAGSEGDKLTTLHSRRGSEGISGSWRKTPFPLRLLCIPVMLGCTGSLLFSRGNTTGLSQSHFTVSFFEWDVLGRMFCFENILWWKSNKYAQYFNF